jgi:CDP-diacylglycerol--glycerol-3-phosphate 3-phosphatidyltransferase
MDPHLDCRWGSVAISERLKPLGLGWPNLVSAMRVSMPASKVAKAKTAAQLLAVGMAMAPLSASFHTAIWAVAFVAVAVTLYSGVEYFPTSTHRVKVD